MRDNKHLAWTSFFLFALSTGMILLFLVLATTLQDFVENPGFLILVVGALALIAAILGFMAFRLPQGKIGAIGGLALFLLVLFVTPVGRTATLLAPQAKTNAQGQTGRTGIPEVDTIIDTVLTGTPQEQLDLILFSSLPCTKADGLGGPPKCAQEESEGTVVGVLPILGPEGHHLRRGELESWEGIRASDVYAVYRVSDRVYADEAYPAGEYAIVFLAEEGASAITAHVKDGKIVRLDYLFTDPSEIDLDQVASEVIMAPKK